MSIQVDQTTQGLAQAQGLTFPVADGSGGGAAGALSTALNTIVVAFPLTLEFDVVRTTLGSVNTGTFNIYNLKPSSRKQVHHDWWETLKYRKIVLSAGYDRNPKLPQIFVGNVQSASSVRQGTNWVTRIEAYSGIYGIQNGQVSLSLQSGFDMKTALVTAATAMPNVSLGAIGDFEPPQSSRGLSLCGNAWDVIQGLVVPQGGECFIDQERACMLQKDDYIDFPGNVLEISSLSEGLLETPQRSQQGTIVEILFEPRVQVGQLIRLTTEETTYNGLYVVKGIRHRGIISGAVGGDCRTVLTLWQNGSAPFNAVAPLS